MVSAKSSDEVMQQDPEDFFLCLSSGEEEEGNDLSYWEFINPSDADDDDDVDVDNDIDSLLSLDSLQNGLFVSLHSSLSSSIAVAQSNQAQEDQDTHFDEDGATLDHRQHVVERVAYVGYQYRDIDDDCDVGDGGGDDDEDDPEDEGMYGDGYDLDDELVPRSVSRKLGRQRMRKLGKRAFTKMYNSKKSPFLYTKPGCVHGKHGLGLKYIC